MSELVQMVECPRDAMQGIHDHIPTDLKVKYINALLKVGFDTLDFGSFVSPKAIPQLADTAEVLGQLNLSGTQTRLLAIIANRRGAEEACTHSEIQFLGYPFSISETFQLRNTRKTIAESLDLVLETQELAVRTAKELVVYLSMGFGNPYGEHWGPEVVEKWVEEMVKMGITTISLADTIGSATPPNITELYRSLVPRYPQVTFGAHFHSHAETRTEKLEAAWDAGCRRFDSAIMGYGGCPFAEDDLVGNMATESLLAFLASRKVEPKINHKALDKATILANEVFGTYS